MTPQAVLRARFGELAAAHGLKLLVRHQKGKYYFNLTGPFEAIDRFLADSFPRAWMTSAGLDITYGLPAADVDRVVADCRLDPAWLEWRDGTVVHLARGICEERAFDRLPVLADALEEAGCTGPAILARCRQDGPSPHGCWVIDLILGPERRTRGVADR